MEILKSKKIDNLADLIKQYVSDKVEIVFPKKEADITFGGDIHDISLSFEKIQRSLNFEGKFTVADGVKEIKLALDNKIINHPYQGKYRNARPFGA